MSHTPSHRDDSAAPPPPAGGDTSPAPAATSDRLRRDEERYVEGHGRRYEEERVQDPEPERVSDHDRARARFGGSNWGACFFGWLVAIAVAVLLTSILGAVAAAVGSSASVTQSQAQRQAGHIGLAAAIVLLVALAIGYYCGGYVAGRMSRYDGARQGFGAWLIGLIITILAIALGAIFGNEYNVLDRVSLPNLPISTDQLGWGAVITAVAVLLLTLVAAVLGGTAGHRYHDRVDRAARGV